MKFNMISKVFGASAVVLAIALIASIGFIKYQSGQILQKEEIYKSCSSERGLYKNQAEIAQRKLEELIDINERLRMDKEAAIAQADSKLKELQSQYNSLRASIVEELERDGSCDNKIRLIDEGLRGFYEEN